MTELIIHMDDVGVCKESLAGLELLATHNKITSCSVQMPAPLAAKAIDLINRLGIDAGVHITLTSEQQAVRYRSLTGGSTLHGPDGYMWPTRQELAQHARDDEVLAEITAQVEFAEQLGLKISHIDTHMAGHFMKKEWLQHAVDLCLERGIAPMLVRSGPVLDELCKENGLDIVDIPEIAEGSERRGCRLLSSLKTDGFGDDRVRDMMTWVENLGPGVHQLIVHPFAPSPQLEQKLGKHRAGKRVEDFLMLMCGVIDAVVKRKEIRLVSWQDLKPKNNKD